MSDDPIFRVETATAILPPDRPPSAVAARPRAPGLPRLAAALACALAAAVPLTGAQPPATATAAQADAAPAAADATLPSADEILARYVEALGGEEAIRRHRQVTWKGSFSMPGQGLEGELTLRAAAPDLFRLDITAPGVGEIAQGYDGQVGWGDNTMTGPTLLKGGELELVSIQSDFYADLHYAAHFPERELLGRETFGEQPCWKLALRTVGGIESFAYFSTESGLLVGTEGDMPTAMGDVWVRTSIGGYRELDGRLYPTENRQEVMGMVQVITLEEPDFGAIDADVFALPPAIRTLVDGMRAE